MNEIKTIFRIFKKQTKIFQTTKSEDFTNARIKSSESYKIVMSESKATSRYQIME